MIGLHLDSSGERDSLSLLYGCIFTIWICGWSAIHLNVPADSDNELTISLRKIKWTIITILAPEFPATNSWHDWVEARGLVKRLNKDIKKGVCSLLVI
jgi:hypothetical protein